MILAILIDLESLLRDLGDDSPDVREAATARLLEMGPDALAAVESHRSRDPEVTMRLRLIAGQVREGMWMLSAEPTQKTFRRGEPVTARVALENRTGVDREFFNSAEVTVKDAAGNVVGGSATGLLFEHWSPSRELPRILHEQRIEGLLSLAALEPGTYAVAVRYAAPADWRGQFSGQQLDLQISSWSNSYSIAPAIPTGPVLEGERTASFNVEVVE